MAYLWLDAKQSLQQVALLTNTAVSSTTLAACHNTFVVSLSLSLPVKSIESDLFPASRLLSPSVFFVLK
jgi:hypothetical protein